MQANFGSANIKLITILSKNSLVAMALRFGPTVNARTDL